MRPGKRPNIDVMQNYYDLTASACHNAQDRPQQAHLKAVEIMANRPTYNGERLLTPDTNDPQWRIQRRMQEAVGRNRMHFSDPMSDGVLGQLPCGYQPPGLPKCSESPSDLRNADVPINMGYIADPVYAYNLYIKPFIVPSIPLVTGQNLYTNSNPNLVTA